MIAMRLCSLFYAVPSPLECCVYLEFSRRDDGYRTVRLVLGVPCAYWPKYRSTWSSTSRSPRKVRVWTGCPMYLLLFSSDCLPSISCVLPQEELINNFRLGLCVLISQHPHDRRCDGGKACGAVKWGFIVHMPIKSSSTRCGGRRRTDNILTLKVCSKYLNIL